MAQRVFARIKLSAAGAVIAIAAATATATTADYNNNVNFAEFIASNDFTIYFFATLNKKEQYKSIFFGISNTINLGLTSCINRIFGVNHGNRCHNTSVLCCEPLNNDSSTQSPINIANYCRPAYITFTYILTHAFSSQQHFARNSFIQRPSQVFLSHQSASCCIMHSCDNSNSSPTKLCTYVALLPL
ncbi:uncharacterized protein LOC129236431 [Anastrepha obliqua]|uniref:uncharacterized protein LOC129236431 n=1 Tax=Anastrepha obliqua TaxID=95512 RepID=UPI00240A2FAE|nr:uncharacterized protein LOC129236431 [Anastrepha obliqua]